MKWISVKDRLPKEGGLFIVCDKDLYVFRVPFDIKLQKFINEFVYMDSWEPFEEGIITHWMPFPKPPQENQEYKISKTTIKCDMCN